MVNHSAGRATACPSSGHAGPGRSLQEIQLLDGRVWGFWACATRRGPGVSA